MWQTRTFFGIILEFGSEFLRIDERSSESYIGADDFIIWFFSRRSLKICSGSNLLFHCLIVTDDRLAHGRTCDF